jgi:hypothetical protein
MEGRDKVQKRIGRDGVMGVRLQSSEFPKAALKTFHQNSRKLYKLTIVN